MEGTSPTRGTRANQPRTKTFNDLWITVIRSIRAHLRISWFAAVDASRRNLYLPTRRSSQTYFGGYFLSEKFEALSLWVRDSSGRWLIGATVAHGLKPANLLALNQAQLAAQ